jgi:hypothetical protein
MGLSFSGPSHLGLATILYCLLFETSLFFASYDSQGHGGGIRLRLSLSSSELSLSLSLSLSHIATDGQSVCLSWYRAPTLTRVVLYNLCTDHAQKTQLYCCVTNIAPWTSHVTPSQYCWSVTSCACVEVCLPRHNLETDCVTPLFHCRCVYYLETADSVA